MLVDEDADVVVAEGVILVDRDIDGVVVVGVVLVDEMWLSECFLM